MEFAFPAGSEKRLRQLVTPRRLAEVLRRHSSLPEGYVERLADLGFAPLEGYLRGFIDLVFAFQGRYFVVDYKSNYLGPHAEAYQPEPLEQVMMHHHYHLQYHLYLVALHRYLKSRLPGYDYAQHVGGALYLFLRGMSPSLPPGAGVFSACPSRECILALSELFEGARDPLEEASP
jgi:exodeoxyribonuclease V beta subunit